MYEKSVFLTSCAARNGWKTKALILRSHTKKQQLLHGDYLQETQHILDFYYLTCVWLEHQVVIEYVKPWCKVHTWWKEGR